VDIDIKDSATSAAMVSDSVAWHKLLTAAAAGQAPAAFTPTVTARKVVRGENKTSVF
jgi:hypothetical protein